MGEHPPQWAALLAAAARMPGIISDAYRRFWNYSFGNQLLAHFQCISRGIEPGPINTFLGWKECGRTVRKGEKALTLCMPVTAKKKQHESKAQDEEPAANPLAQPVTRFVYRRHWFVLAQTDGKPYVPPAIPAWDETTALCNLKILRVPFHHSDGNVQGYALRRTVAVSPIAFMPHRTLFHEMAHVVLGHTQESESFEDDEHTPRQCFLANSIPPEHWSVHPEMAPYSSSSTEIDISDCESLRCVFLWTIRWPSFGSFRCLSALVTAFDCVTP